MLRLEDTLTNLDIFLGDTCNLRCVHCPCWINESAPRFAPDVLEARLFEAVEYAAACPRFEKVMLIGGEPFIHEGMVSFLRKQRIDTCITVYTNFVWPDPDIALPDNVFFLSSMDAPSQAVYGQLRRTKDFAYSQELMRKQAAQLLHVDTTVSKGNVKHLDEILNITESYGCTHWFLPIDPRVLRYNDVLSKDSNLGTLTERRHASVTADRARSILLDDGDIAMVKQFYEHHGSDRTNDYETFLGIYLSSIDRFKAETFGYRNDIAVSRPQTSKDRCPGIRRYMEISYTPEGQFIPMVHCPELWDILGTRQGPPAESIEALMSWENETRQHSDCRVFCGRTQFLGIDEYEQSFRNVVAH